MTCHSPRGRAMGIFYACAAATGVLGGPLSGNPPLDGWHCLAAAAAGGIAMISSVGSVPGYAAPWMVEIVRDCTGSCEVPMMLASLFLPAAAPAIQAAPRMAERMAARQAP
jgi:hypothetical protein